jgi:uncharacterized protein YneF (UPF0154 family)
MKIENILNTVFFGLGILFLLYLFIGSGNFKASEVNPTILVAIIAGMVSLGGYFITRSLDRQKLIEQQIREQKLPVYNEFVVFILDAVIGQKLTQEQMMDFIEKFNQKSIVWLSDRTFKAYVEWAKALKKATPGGDPMINLILLENLLKEFRLDIGHKNKDIDKGDILSLFINDMEKYDMRNY